MWPITPGLIALLQFFVQQNNTLGWIIFVVLDPEFSPDTVFCLLALFEDMIGNNLVAVGFPVNGVFVFEVIGRLSNNIVVDYFPYCKSWRPRNSCVRIIIACPFENCHHHQKEEE